MKKVLLALALMLSVTCLAGEKSSTVHNSNNIDATVELVNDSTLVYRNIDRLDVFQTSRTNNTGIVLKYIPYMPDYKHNWTDEEIKNEIGLTQEQYEFIKTEMKDYGWKTFKQE